MDFVPQSYVLLIRILWLCRHPLNIFKKTKCSLNLLVTTDNCTLYLFRLLHWLFPETQKKIPTDNDHTRHLQNFTNFLNFTKGNVVKGHCLWEKPCVSEPLSILNLNVEGNCFDCLLSGLVCCYHKRLCIDIFLMGEKVLKMISRQFSGLCRQNLPITSIRTDLTLVHEMILMSAFRWLVQQKWYVTPLLQHCYAILICEMA